MPTLSDWQTQILQVVVVLACAPFVSGVIARLEAIVQMRRGPSVFQPYRDIRKWLGKETVLPGEAGAIFRAAPYVSFAGYATVPLLIPVLTSFPLPLGYMGDILGGGFILGLASFVVSLAAIDSGSPYAQLGSSRLRSFGALGEPTIIFVIFTVALITHTDLPYVIGGDPARLARRVLQSTASAGGRGVLHGPAGRDGPHPGPEPRWHARVRHDRGRAGARALRARACVPALGVVRQAARADDDLRQRARRAVGPCRERRARSRRVRGDRPVDREGARRRRRSRRDRVRPSRSSASTRSRSSRSRASCWPCWR